MMITVARPSATSKSRVHARASRRKGCGGRGSSVEAAAGGRTGSIISALISYTTARRAASRLGIERRKNLLAGSFLGGEQRDIARDAKRPAVGRIVVVEALDSGDVPHESAGRDLQSDARLPAAFRAIQRRNNFPGRVAAINFADQMNMRSKRIAKRKAIKRLVVLRIQRIGRSHDLNPKVAEHIELPEI